MNAVRKKSKICSKCGFSKPIEEFILGSIDAKCGKQESDICRTCRQENVSTWTSRKKKTSEKKEFFEDTLIKKPKKPVKKAKSLGKTKKQQKIGLFQ